MTTKYLIADSKGRLWARSTKNRTYTHAVVIDYVSSWAKDENGQPVKCVNVQWAGRLDLAQKAAQQKWGSKVVSAEIVPAVEVAR